ncbi:MAG: TIM barrel protein, partial [Bacteroidota bacterium]
MNKIGIYFAYWSKNWNADFLYYIKKVADLGFDILEISTACLVDLPKEKLNQIKNLAADKGIELTYCIGFSKDKDLAAEDSRIRKNGIDYAKKTLDIIHYMNGKIFAGINYSSWPGALEEGMVDKRPFLERSVNSLKEIIKTAEDYDILYCIEVVNRFEQYLINTAAEGVAFVEEVGSSHLK